MHLLLSFYSMVTHALFLSFIIYKEPCVPHSSQNSKCSRSLPRKAQDLWSKGCGFFCFEMFLNVTSQNNQQESQQIVPAHCWDKLTTAPAFSVTIKPQSISFPWFPFFQHCSADASITFWYPSLMCVWMLICPYSCSLKSELMKHLKSDHDPKLHCRASHRISLFFYV